MDASILMAWLGIISLFVISVSMIVVVYRVMTSLLHEQRNSQDRYIERIELNQKQQNDALLLLIENLQIKHDSEVEALKNFISHIVEDFKDISKEQLRSHTLQSERFLKDMQAWIITENDRKDENTRRIIVEAITSTLNNGRKNL